MGDWANGELKQALEDGPVDAQPFPGSEGTFVFTSDTFPLPVAAPYAERERGFARNAGLARRAVGIQPRKRLDPRARGHLDRTRARDARRTRARRPRRDFDSPEIHKSIATSGLFPPYFPDDLSTQLSTMTAEGASKRASRAVIALIRNTLPLLKRWQSRITEGQQPP